MLLSLQAATDEEYEKTVFLDQYAHFRFWIIEASKVCLLNAVQFQFGLNKVSRLPMQAAGC